VAQKAWSSSLQSTSRSVEYGIWHPSISSSKNEICKGCMLGKNINKAFPSNDSRAQGILDLIHSDVCGPMSSPSLSGCLYYVIFIDDCSRKCWI
jgi:hypothetical protein